MMMAGDRDDRRTRPTEASEGRERPDAAAPDKPAARGGGAEEASGAPEERARDAVADLEEAERGMEALEAERDELFGRLQRVSADYHNFMRRAEQKLADAIDLARGDTLRGFIPVLDDFDRALGAEPGGEEARALARGVRMVRQKLLKALEEAGVERIEPKVGERFDPHVHEAMLQQPAEGVAPNHIAAAFEPGYTYRGRTLRPAKVAVAPAEA